MAVLRFLSVSLLAFFLLGPVLVQYLNDVQKPLIVMVMDNSESITAADDVQYYKTEFLEQWQDAGNVLGKDYEVEFLNLAGDINRSDSVKFNQKKTNLSILFDHINNTYSRQNIGAVILASDGIYNRGNNPIYKSLSKQTTLYTVGMGDTIIKKDAMIRDVNHNAIAYLNNRFPLEVNIAAYECQGSNSILNVVSDGKTLYNESIQINSKDFFKTILLDLEADKPGTKHIVVSITKVEGEVSVFNNKKDIFIDILDGREKILLLYQGPHPDIGAIKEAISSNQNYELKQYPVNGFKVSELKEYSVVILHQLPSRGSNSSEIISQIRKSGIPIWCITGNQTAIEQLNLISPQGRIDRNQGRTNESQAEMNEQFTAFTLEDNTKKSLNDFPPLKTPYGLYAATNNTEILAFQKIGQVSTKIPIWAFSNQDGEKTAFLFGEGFWRWRLFDYVKNENHEATNELVHKTIQYLAVKEDKRKFRVYPVKNNYDEDETVRFIAELYNASYEPINTAEVKLNLYNSDKKVYNYSFSKNGNAYRLDLGILPAGIYTFTAKAEGIAETMTGKLIITPLQTELVNTRADHGLLRQIAYKHTGKFYNARDIKKVIEEIKKNETISSVSYKERRPDELINIKWIFFLLIALISAEWFIRKYEGAY